MSRVHDMGGRFGDGALNPEGVDAPVFAKEWHARAMAITVASGPLGQWTIDAMRHARERLAPKDYCAFSYYEKWVAALADMLVARDMVSREELAAGAASGVSALAERTLHEPAVAGVLARGAPCDREVAAPRFAVGDLVRTGAARNASVAGGHTRLPAYAAHARGQILAQRGGFVFPDTNAHGLGEQPQNLYTVAFDAAELWGKAEAAGDEVTLDLFESYLVPA